ncbi:MAG: hypothetical protein V1732_04795 [Patescibacteria group bacterium]
MEREVVIKWKVESYKVGKTCHCEESADDEAIPCLLQIATGLPRHRFGSGSQ